MEKKYLNFTFAILQYKYFVVADVSHQSSCICHYQKNKFENCYIIQRHAFPFRAPIRLSFLVHASGMDGSFERSLTKQIDGIYEQWKGYCSVAKWTQKFPRVGVVNLTLADASIRKLSTQGTRQGGANCQVRVGGPSHVQTFRFAV